MYSHHLQESYERQRNNTARSDPQGYQNRGRSNSTPNHETIMRKMNHQTPPASRPPLAGSVDRRDMIYNSFTSTYHGQGLSDSKRDPPPTVGMDPQRGRRVIFSKQLEIHEKHRAQTPSTPTIPILRASTRSRKASTPTRNESLVDRHASRRDPTPRSTEKVLRSAPRPAEKRKTIHDILNEQVADHSVPRSAMSDPPLDRSRRPLFSPAVPKSPKDIFAKIEQRSRSASHFEKVGTNSDHRSLIEPEAETPKSHPRPGHHQGAAVINQSWDLSDLFPDSSQPSTPLGMHRSPAADRSTSRVASNIPKPPPPPPPDDSSNLKAYEPQRDSWNGPDMYSGSWNQIPRDMSPGNSSTESQDACLIAMHAPTSSNGGDATFPINSYSSPQRLDEQMTPSQHTGVFRADGQKARSTTKRLKGRSERTRYSHLDEDEDLESHGTELVLIPRVQGRIERTDNGYPGKDASTTSRNKRRGLGGLMKRGTPGPASSTSVPFQELPVLAMSFEDSVELKNNTDETDDSDSGVFKRKGQQWNVDRESSSASYDDDDFLMPHYGGRSWKKWRVVLMLVCLVVVCLSIGLPVYYSMVVRESGTEEVVGPDTVDVCVDTEFEQSLFSKRYIDMRKAIMATTEGNPTMADEPGSAQRKALCWISEVDTLIGEFDGGSIPAIVQRYTLAVIYYSLVADDDKSERSLKRTNFLSSSHECEWSVIMCSSPGTVSTLLMADKELSGSIPAEISSLGGLSFLELSLNGLTGTIPTSIEKLSLLEYFAVAFNSFSGPVPSELGLLTKLEFINMRSSQVHGKIPTELGRLGQLETLLLEGNWLSGTIPQQLGSLVNAQQMSFRKNYLTGRVPTDLCELRDISLAELKVDSWIECDCCTA